MIVRGGKCTASHRNGEAFEGATAPRPSKFSPVGVLQGCRLLCQSLSTDLANVKKVRGQIVDLMKS